MFTRMSYKLKFPIMMGIIAFVILGVITVTFMTKTTNVTTTIQKENARSEAVKYAGMVEADFNKGLYTARTLANAFGGMLSEDGNMNPKSADNMIKQVLQGNPDIYGIWSVWEPGAFTGAEGFTPYWRRSGYDLVPDQMADIRNSEYKDCYTVPRDTVQEAVSPPYTREIAGESTTLCTLSAPVTEDGSVIGVVGVDIDIRQLTDRISALKPMGSGYVELIDNSGTYVVAEKTSLIGQDIGMVGDTMQMMKVKSAVSNGITMDFTENPGKGLMKEVFSTYMPARFGNAPTPWSIAVKIPMSRILSEPRKLGSLVLRISALALLLLIASGFLVARNITVLFDKLLKETTRLTDEVISGNLRAKGNEGIVSWEFQPIITGVNDILTAMEAPILEAASVLGKIAKGDLTARVEGDYQGDFASIKESINRTCISLESVILQVRDKAEQVTVSARMVYAAAESVGEASIEVTSGAQQVAGGSAQLASSASAAASNMDQLMQAITEVAKGAQVQASGAEEAAFAAERASESVKGIFHTAENARSEAMQARNEAVKGVNTTDSMVTNMAKVRKAAIETGERVNALGKASKRIGEIVDAISDIADQTNLLALNASIEAARAGDHGRGFAVVADEVRKLAERSAGQTKEIAGIIGEIRDEITRAVSAMASGTKEMDDAAILTEEAGLALNSIVSAADRVLLRTQEVVKACGEVEEHSSRVLQSAENISAVTEQATAATEEMTAASTEVSAVIGHVARVTDAASTSSEALSATAEEQNALVGEVTATTKDMARLADEVMTAVSVFRVTGDSYPDEGTEEGSCITDGTEGVEENPEKTEDDQCSGDNAGTGD